MNGAVMFAFLFIGIVIGAMTQEAWLLLADAVYNVANEDKIVVYERSTNSLEGSGW